MKTIFVLTEEIKYRDEYGIRWTADHFVGLFFTAQQAQDEADRLGIPHSGIKRKQV